VLSLASMLSLAFVLGPALIANGAATILSELWRASFRFRDPAYETERRAWELAFHMIWLLSCSTISITRWLTRSRLKSRWRERLSENGLSRSRLTRNRLSRNRLSKNRLSKNRLVRIEGSRPAPLI